MHFIAYGYFIITFIFSMAKPFVFLIRFLISIPKNKARIKMIKLRRKYLLFKILIFNFAARIFEQIGNGRSKRL
jgi:hypothetical protein